MPRRRLLTPAERDDLLAFPTTEEECIRHYTFSESDLAIIHQRRGNHNRFGFAVQLCYFGIPDSPCRLMRTLPRCCWHLSDGSWASGRRSGHSTRSVHKPVASTWLNCRHG